MKTTAAMRRRGAAIDAMTPEQLHQYSMQEFGVPWGAADYLAGVGARIHRGESITAKDIAEMKTIYPQLGGHYIDNVARFVNGQPQGPNRLHSFTAALAGGDGPMRQRLASIIQDYHTLDISDAIIARRNADVPKDSFGRKLPDTPKPPNDPLSVRSLIERQINGPRNEAAREYREDPEKMREFLSNKADTALDRLQARSEGASDGPGTDVRGALEDAYDLHASLDVAVDQGFVEDDDK